MQQQISIPPHISSLTFLRLYYCDIFVRYWLYVLVLTTDITVYIKDINQSISGMRALMTEFSISCINPRMHDENKRVSFNIPYTEGM